MINISDQRCKISSMKQSALDIEDENVKLEKNKELLAENTEGDTLEDYLDEMEENIKYLNDSLLSLEGKINSVDMAIDRVHLEEHQAYMNELQKKEEQKDMMGKEA